MRALQLAVLLVVACGEPVVRERVVDTGTPACLVGDMVHVRFDGCLSSSCDTVKSSSCFVTLIGDEAKVMGSAIIESRDGACTDDCGMIEATCSGTLGAATTVRFAGAEVARNTLVLCE